MYYIANRIHYGAEKRSIKMYSRFLDIFASPILLENSRGMFVFRSLSSGDHLVISVDELIRDMKDFFGEDGWPYYE